MVAKSPELCLSCHKDLKEKMDKEKVHQPALADCQKCHKPHFSSETTLLNQAIQPLCGECHDLKSAQFSKSHLSIEPSIINCRHCHDPHSSKSPKYFKSVTHPPFEGRSCDECHIVGKQ